MLGIFKKIFGRDSGEPARTPAPEPVASAPPSKPESPPAQRHPPSPAAPPGARDGSAGSLALTLKGVIGRLPPDLKTKVKQQPRADLCINIPLNTILDQLPRGAVKITFGELRQAAPPGTFADAGGHDEAAVELPLQEILSRLKPNQFARHPGQKRVEVPDEVRPIFGEHGKTLAPPPPAAATETPEPVSRPAAGESPKPAAPIAPVPTVPPAPTPTPIPAPKIPFASVAPKTADSAPIKPIAPLPKPAAPIAPTPTVPAAPAPAPIPAPRIPVAPLAAKAVDSAPIKPIAPLPEPPRKTAPASPTTLVPQTPAKLPSAQPQATPAPAVATTPAPTPPKPPASTSETGVLNVSLGAVCGGWPGPVRQEMAQRNLAAAKLELPLSEVSAGLRSGKLVFTWLQIRNWLQPPMALSATSANDGIKLELPLPVIIPLFMPNRQPAAPQRKIVVGENIPDLFKGTGVTAVPETITPAAAVPSAVAAPATPAPKPVEPSPVAPRPAPPSPLPTAPALSPRGTAVPTLPQPMVRPAPAQTGAPAAALDIGEALRKPGKSQWTPLEIVQEASLLPGVSGALIAMQDGLLVADRVPPPLHPETFAAFLPQLFGRMSHYINELKLGEPSSVTVVVAGAPLQIFKAGQVYFTVVGRVGESLPEPQLQAIAAYLSRQTK